MKYKCVIVPECPRCKSACTGYFIYGINEQDKDWVEINRLKRGEYVSAMSRHKHFDDKDFFCFDCGAEWSGKKEEKWLSKEEIQNEKQKRMISKELEYSAKHYKEAYITKNHKLKRTINKIINTISNISV